MGPSLRRLLGGIALLVALAGVALVSLSIGSGNATWLHVWGALTAFDGSNEHIIVREMRLPRTIIGLAIGAALGVSGGLMQAITRNPLAEPGI
ncbi:MAG TPA: iron ABC transporter permease, partial [Candidatus Agrococcus pullicola]|nr:iron ABC transporter permease [Candidatus Agrococcus pullicola]